MKRTLQKLPTCLHGANLTRLVSSSRRGDTQPLFEPFVRPLNREQKHKIIKETLKTRTPHPKFNVHMRAIIAANVLTKQQRKNRGKSCEKLRAMMEKRFGKGTVDVVDISMAEFGVSVGQSPCELAVIDLRNPDGLPMGINNADVPNIYSPMDILRTVKKVSPTASLRIFANGPAFPTPMQLPALKIMTDEYRVALPSPLHRARRELVKEYCENYPMFRDLLNLITLFHYCTKSTLFEPLALAYHVLTFFRVRCQIPSFVESGHVPGPPISGKSTEIKGGPEICLKSVHFLDRGELTARRLDTKISPRWAKASMADLLLDGIPMPLGTNEFKLFYGYLKWTLDIDFRTVAFNPGKGLVSRFPVAAKYRVRRKAEAEMLRQGLLDREEAPKDQQTLDWNHTDFVVQDPFFPLENLTPAVPAYELNRIRHMAEVVIARLDDGEKLPVVMEHILHPHVTPPIMPGFTLERKLDLRPHMTLPPVAENLPHTRDHIQQEFRLDPRDEDPPSSLSTPRPRYVIKTPTDLEGDLFR